MSLFLWLWQALTSPVSSVLLTICKDLTYSYWVSIWEPDTFSLITTMCSPPNFVFIACFCCSARALRIPAGHSLSAWTCSTASCSAWRFTGHSCRVVIDDVIIFFTKLVPLWIEAGTYMESTAVPLLGTYPDLFCMRSREQDEGETDRCPWVLSHFVVN